MVNPIIVIHSADHARAALSIATELGIAVTLHSPAGAVAYLGATVFRDMVKAAAEDHPEADYLAVLDCGDDPGLALGAMRHGIKAVRVHVAPEIRAKLAEVADQRGVKVFDEDGPAIDLNAMSDPHVALRAWLTGPL